MSNTLTYLIQVNLGESRYEPEDFDAAMLGEVGPLVEQANVMDAAGVEVLRVGESREDFGGKPLLLAEYEFGDHDE